MNCGSKKVKNDKEKRKPGNAQDNNNAQNDDREAPLQSAIKVSRMGSFYSRCNKDMVPLKVDYMSLTRKSNDSKVDRFVILTKDHLIVYDEDKTDGTFQEQHIEIKNVQLKKVDEVTLQVSSDLALIFRSADHLQSWHSEITNV